MSIKLIATMIWDGTFLRDDHTYNHSLFTQRSFVNERHNSVYFCRC